jgi:hypothetical protein
MRSQGALDKMEESKGIEEILIGGGVVPALHAATEAAEGGPLRLRLRDGRRRAGSHQLEEGCKMN